MSEAPESLTLERTPDEEIDELQIEAAVYNYAQMDSEHPEYFTTKLRIQRAMGTRAIPSIIENVRERELSPISAVKLIQGMDGDDQELYSGYKEILLQEDTYKDTEEWSATSRALSGILATSQDEQTFNNDLSEIKRNVMFSDCDDQTKDRLLIEMENMRENYESNKTENRNSLSLLRENTQRYYENTVLNNLPEGMRIGIEESLEQFVSGLNNHLDNVNIRSKIQVEYGTRAIPAILLRVHLGELSSWEAAMLMHGINGSDTQMHKYYKDLALMRATHSDPLEYDGLYQSMQGIIATSDTRETLIGDLNEIENIVTSAEYEDNVKTAIITEINNLRNDSGTRKADAVALLANWRNVATSEYNNSQDESRGWESFYDNLPQSDQERLNRIETLRNFAGMQWNPSQFENEKVRIQQQEGIRILPSVIESVREGILPTNIAVNLVNGITTENEVLQDFFYELASERATFNNEDLTALKSTISGLTATSETRADFEIKILNLEEVIRNENIDSGIRNNLIGFLESSLTNYEETKLYAREFLESARRQSSVQYNEYIQSDPDELEIGSLLGEATLTRLQGAQSNTQNRPSPQINIVSREPINPPNSEIVPEVKIISREAIKKEPKKLVKLEKEAVGRILQGSLEKDKKYVKDLDVDNPYQKLDHEQMSRAIKLAESFYAVLANEEQYKAFPLGENEIAFIDAARAEFGNLPPDVDRRIVKSQIASLHTLIFSGGLDTLFRNYLAEQIRKDRKFPERPIDVIEIKSQLAHAFLETVEHKNREQEMTDLESGAISMGVEVEFETLLKKELKTKPIYEELRADLENQLQSTKSPREKAIYEKYLNYIKYKIAAIEKINSFDELTIDSDIHMWEPGVAGKYKLNIIKRQGDAEINTKPSASYKTQLRELVASATIGGIRDNWGIHETFQGIRLSKEHTEFMDAFPIGIAADFYEFPKIEESIKENLTVGHGVQLEHYRKTSYAANDSTHFPWHQPRRGVDLDDFNEKVLDKRGVQLRSIPDSTPKGFIKMVRQMSFNYLFAHGVKAIQKSVDQRTEQDKKLVGAYESLMQSWTELMNSRNIHIPINNERYMDNNAAQHDLKLQANPYVFYVGQMIVLSQDDPEFVKATRKIVTEYNKRTREILGLAPKIPERSKKKNGKKQ